MKKRLRIVFMGTPGFAVPSLLALYEAGFEVAGVVTQPDRPRGRGQKITASPVKEEAGRLGLKVYQPLKVRDEKFIQELKGLEPDLLVVAAYGQILPKEALEIPAHGCINVHASLLPLYRGAAPIHWAVLNGEKETGITIMLMDEGLDTGDILTQEKALISNDMNCGELHDLLSQKGAGLLVKTVELWISGKIKPRRQDDDKASYAPLLKREDEQINWQNSAARIKNQVRGLEPWPGAYTVFNGRPLKIRGAETWECEQSKECPGTILGLVKGQGFVVQTGEGCILVTRVQPFGKNTMSSDSFMNGYNLQKGYIFDD